MSKVTVSASEGMRAFVQAMPKVELHLHLEGSIRPATVLDLARRHRVPLPADDLQGLRSWYRFRNFTEFLDVWSAVLSCLRTADDFARITRELGEDLRSQSVYYAGVTFTPAVHEKHRGLSYDEVWEGIALGSAWVERELWISLRFIPDIPRNLRPGTDGAVAASRVESTPRLRVTFRTL